VANNKFTYDRVNRMPTVPGGVNGCIVAIVNAVLIVLLFVATFLLYIPDDPPRSYFGSTPRYPPSDLFYRGDNFLVSSNFAVINTYARLVVNNSGTRAVTSLVLFIHGFPETARLTWDSVAAILERKSLEPQRVLYAAYDFRGFNHSKVEADAPLTAFAANEILNDIPVVVAALIQRYNLDENEIEVHLVVHDIGGMTSWLAWQYSPIGDLLKSFTAVNGPHPQGILNILNTTDQFERSEYAYEFQLPTWMLSTKLLGNHAAAMQYLYVANTRKGDMYIGALDDFVEYITTPGVLDPMLNFYRAWIQHQPASFNNISDIPKVPVSIIWGLKDTALNPLNLNETVHIAMAAGAPSVCAYILPDTGHFPAIDDPEVIAIIVADTLNGKKPKPTQLKPLGVLGDFCV